MHPDPRKIAPAIAVVLIAGAAGWFFFGRGAARGGPLTASGTIEATEINLSPELGGRVSAVNVREGDGVKAGDVLIQFDTTLLQTQRGQAAAALAAASANYQLLKNGPSSDQGVAQIARAELELLQARQALDDLLSTADIARAEAELTAANAKQALYDAERRFNSAQYPDVGDYEQALSDTLDKLNIAQANTTINDLGALGAAIQAAQDAVDASRDRLGDVQAAEAACQNCDPDRLARAQDNYNGALNNLNVLQLQLNIAQTNNAQAIRNAEESVQDAEENLTAAKAGPNARQLAIARGGLSVAQAKLAHALEHFDEVKDGPDPDLLATARARVAAAEAALKAAQAGASPDQLDAAQAQVDMARAALDVIDAQIAKLTLTAPVDAVVLSRAVEPGEVVSPGAPLIVVGQLDNLTITVYVSEDRYGEIKLSQAANVSADSFPGEKFTATVTHIADRAEFTPRNVQTASGRKTTVIAIKLSIDNSSGKLKPGMPADVQFRN